MQYRLRKPCPQLEPFLHFYWELKGNQGLEQWERVLPDGCPGVLMNLGGPCLTDNGSVRLAFGKTYVVGAMTSYKDSLIEGDTHLVGACFKPGNFGNFYLFADQNELTNATVELDRSRSFRIDKATGDPFTYFDHYYSERLKTRHNPLQPVLDDIHAAKGQIGIYELSKRHFTTVRQLQRAFRKQLGHSPKEYGNIIRFRYALSLIANRDRSLSDIAWECGYYDPAHLSNEIRRMSGLSPSML